MPKSGKNACTAREQSKSSYISKSSRAGRLAKQANQSKPSRQSYRASKSANQPTNQPTNQSTDQLTNQPTNYLTSQPTNRGADLANYSETKDYDPPCLANFIVRRMMILKVALKSLKIAYHVV